MLDKIILKGKEVQMSDDEFFAFCQANPELNIERSPQREIIIMTPTGSTSGFIQAFTAITGNTLYLGYFYKEW